MAEQTSPEVAAALAKLSSYAPGFAGAVVSLAFIDRLTIRGRVVAVVVGVCTAMYLGPAFSEAFDLVWPGPLPNNVRRGVEFLTALSAMGCLPPLLAFMRRVAGDPLALLKMRAPAAGGDK